MDFIISPLIEIFKGPFIKYIGRPIKRHITYPFTYRSNVESVVQVAEELKGETMRLQDSVDAAKRNNGEIYPDVENWLKDSAAVAEEVRGVVEDKEEAAKQGCFLGFCPRYKVSKAADKMVKVIDELQQKKARLETICRPARPQQLLEPLVIKPEAFESRLSVLNQVMDALRDSRNDSKLHRIGVYGMGGVGKSTLAKEIQTLSAKEKLFEDVVFVAVSQTPEIARIQRNLADALGLTLDQEEISVRANQLYERMKGKKILVILDDIWEKFDLNDLGISDWDDFKDCKVVVTSRRRDVLSNKIGTEREFMLRVLENEESFSLFASTVTHAMEETFNDIAKNIVERCGGLPLLILLIASELKNCKDLRMWKAKWRQVSTFDDAEIEKNVHSVIRRSYDELGDEIKSFFLLCALCGQSNVRIQSLERYCLGLGFLKSRHTVDDVRNELVCWIQQLQNRCLLLPGDMDGFVKLHDTIRDAALSIACKEKHAFTSQSGVQWRALAEQNHRRISLPYSDLQKIFESDSQLPLFNCPEAELFLLLTEDLSLRIPDLFFQGIRKLRVLEFTGMGFGSLPSSIDLLKSLQTLCLHNCHLKEVAIIGELRQLEVLSFVDSFIVSLPNQIEQLTRLKILDLSNCSKLALVPANVLSKMKMLEELYMGNSFDQWEAMDVEKRTKGSLGELGDLKSLTTLELQVPFGELVSELRLSSLDRYKIWIGDVWDWAGKYKTSRTMKLMLRTHIKKIYRQVEKLLRNCEDLYLNQAGGIDVLFDTGFPQLKHLHVQNNTLIQHIINTGKVDSTRAFPVLESLVVDNLINLEKICHGQQAACYFKELRVLKVMNCEKLTSLLSVSMARCLFQLEEIEVISCAEIQAIVVGETDEDGAIEFKQLRSLNLRKLPNLRSFFSREEPVESQVTQWSEIVMEGQLDNPTLFCEKVSLPSLINLIITECHSFKSLFTISFAKSLYRLKELIINKCKYVEEMIAAGEVLEEGSKHSICFPQLEVMDFYMLEKLIRFCNGISIEFHSLKKLKICVCRALRTFISGHPISGSMVNRGAKADSETNQDFIFNEMVAFPLEMMELSWTGNFKRIWHNQLDPASFTKLKHLEIYGFDYLQTLFSSNVLEMFRRLESLRLFYCKSLQYVFDLQEITSTKRNNVVAAFELRKLYVEECDSLKQIWNDPQEVLNFQNLQSVRVKHCRALKNVFPTSTARNGLLQLQELDISYCEKMEEIIGKTESDTSEESPCFKFPQLTSLCLTGLPKLTSFYPDKHSSQWPKLKKLKVCGCYKAIKFGSESGGEYLNQPLLFTENVNGCLEELTLEGEDLTLMHQRDDQLPVERFSRLKTLTLDYLDRDQTLLSAFLGKLYCLENLIVCEGYVERLFSLQELLRECEYVNSLQQLKNLKLEQVHNLEHIWEEESQLTQYLQSLRISWCTSLICIAPSSSSFKNLLTLDVHFCESLAYLVIASTAKTMVQLTKLKTVSCWVMKEIVSKDGDQTEITFDKLKTLELSGLWELTSFCSGNHSFNFPSLEEVLVYSCNRKLGTFSGGSLCTPKLRGVEFEEEEIEWEGNLNDTISRHLRKNLEIILRCLNIAMMSSKELYHPKEFCI